MALRVAWFAVVRPCLYVSWVESDVWQVAGIAGVWTGRRIAIRQCVAEQRDGECCMADPRRVGCQRSVV